MKKCNKCKSEFPDSQFPFSSTGDKTKRIGFCTDCNVKVKEYNTKYRKDPKGAKVIAKAKERWKKSDRGIAITKVYSNGQLNKDAQSKYWKSEKGKLACHSRLTKHRHSIDLQIGFWQLLSGSRKTSAVVFRCTEFKSANDVLAHVKSTLSNSSKWEDYGSLWEIDHIIPRSAYNHDDPEDVYRCWSRGNIRSCTKVENRSKNCSIDRALVEAVPLHLHPKQWSSGGSSV